MNGLQAIGVLAIRIWAAETIFSSITQLALQITLVLQSVGAKSASGYDQSTTIFFIIWLAVGFCAWIIAPPLATFALPDRRGGEGVSIDMGANEFVRMGCFLIGVFYIVDVTPFLFTNLLYALDEMHTNDFDAGRVSPMHYVGVTASVIKLTLALMLMMRPSGVAKILSALRTAGLSKVDEK